MRSLPSAPIATTEEVVEDRDVSDDASYYPPSYNMSWGEETVRVYVYDTTDKANMKLVRETEITGNYKTSRKIGSSVYVVTNKYTWYRAYQTNLPMIRDVAVADSDKTGSAPGAGTSSGAGAGTSS